MRTVRIMIFISAAIILALGLSGSRGLEKQAGMAFLLGSLTLGGGILITGLFSLKMPWHGIIGAGVLALLGFGRGILNLPHFAEFLAGQRERGYAPLFEICVTVVCGLLLITVYRTWSAERIRSNIGS